MVAIGEARAALGRAGPSHRFRRGAFAHPDDGRARRHPDQPQHGRSHQRGRRRAAADARLPGDRHRSVRHLRAGFRRLAGPATHVDTRDCASTRSACGRSPTTCSRRAIRAGPSSRSPTRPCRPSWGCSTARTTPSRSTASSPRGSGAPPAADLNIGLTNLPTGYTVIPNPDLQPERSRGAEAGVRVKSGAVEAMVTAYYTRYSDLIVSRAALACPGDPRCVPGATGTFQSRNVSSARIYGLEAKAAWRFATGWTARAAFAIPRGDDIGKDAPLNSIDPPQLVAGVGYETPSWGAALHVDPHVGADPRRPGLRRSLRASRLDHRGPHRLGEAASVAGDRGGRLQPRRRASTGCGRTCAASPT